MGRHAGNIPARLGRTPDAGRAFSGYFPGILGVMGIRRGQGLNREDASGVEAARAVRRARGLD